MSIQQNLVALIDRERITQETFARKIGRSQGAVSQWISGTKPPSMASVKLICKAFNLTEDDIISTERGLYAKLHGLKVAAEPSSMLVPLLGTTHMGEYADEEECNRMVEVPANVVKAHPGGFCVHADGECMNNRYPSDSVLFIDPHMQPFDGCAVLAETDQYQSIVRKYSKGSTSLMLSPDSHSDSYEDIIVRADDAPVKLKGVVVWYQAEKDLR